MKIVIDCNVFVSAVLGSKVCRQVIKRALLDCQIFYSKATLTELESVLKRPNFKAFQDAGNEIINAVKILGCGLTLSLAPLGFRIQTTKFIWP